MFGSGLTGSLSIEYLPLAVILKGSRLAGLGGTGLESPGIENLTFFKLSPLGAGLEGTGLESPGIE